MISFNTGESKGFSLILSIGGTLEWQKGWLYGIGKYGIAFPLNNNEYIYKKCRLLVIILGLKSLAADLGFS